jgi:hypothetical protein
MILLIPSLILFNYVSPKTSDISSTYEQAFLSNLAYEDSVILNGQEVILKEGVIVQDDFNNKYEIIAVSGITNTGYKAYAFRNTSNAEITVAHRGSDELLHDLVIADILQIGLGILPGQVKDAVNFEKFV